MIDDNRVYVSSEAAKYCQLTPFDPSEAYPEHAGVICGKEDNPAYRAFRNLLNRMGFDPNNFGTSDWNPLGEVISPGNTVVLKPNFVKHENSRKDASSRLDLDCLVTHGSVIRAVVDYVAIALQGSGRVIIADCPLQSADWEELVEMVGLDSIVDYFESRFPGIEIKIRDYRLWRSVYRGGHMIAGEMDENGFAFQQELDLGRHSLLVPLMNEGTEFGVTQYPRQRMKSAHTPDVNKYICPKEFLDADVMINLPKMKSHMKAGVTGSLKNFVGTNGHKDYLPHFRYGSPKEGGDEHPDGNWLWDLMWDLAHRSWDTERARAKSLWQRLSRFVQLTGYLTGLISPKECRKGGGSWYGNDTLWRTILDINRAFFYYDRESGQMGDNPWPKVRYITFLDGLVGGHKMSPLSPEPIRAGFMLGAFNPVALDTVATALMGFDYRKIKQISNCYQLESLPLATFRPEDIVISGDIDASSVADIYQKRLFCEFKPSDGWKGKVEWNSTG